MEQKTSCRLLDRSRSHAVVWWLYVCWVTFFSSEWYDSRSLVWEAAVRTYDGSIMSECHDIRYLVPGRWRMVELLNALSGKE